MKNLVFLALVVLLLIGIIGSFRANRGLPIMDLRNGSGVTIKNIIITGEFFNETIPVLAPGETHAIISRGVYLLPDQITYESSSKGKISTSLMMYMESSDGTCIDAVILPDFSLEADYRWNFLGCFDIRRVV